MEPANEPEPAVEEIATEEPSAEKPVIPDILEEEEKEPAIINKWKVWLEKVMKTVTE